jgi:hypothetical protein
MLSVACDSESKGWSTIPQIAGQDSNDPRQPIEALGLRIAEHVQFMCASGTSGGTSAEVRERLSPLSTKGWLWWSGSSVESARAFICSRSACLRGVMNSATANETCSSEKYANG